ncbi:MAG: hypothetical protein U9N34_09935 [Candidatus Cloacimonadota bacterium]|nr:hypothetical protein [Candidatus Cloacimonadota bacterium]
MNLKQPQNTGQPHRVAPTENNVGVSLCAHPDKNSITTENVGLNPCVQPAYIDNLVLYRTNAQSRKIEEALMIANIPYRVI